jgi:hypothetical protein
LSFSDEAAEIVTQELQVPRLSCSSASHQESHSCDSLRTHVNMKEENVVLG